MKYFSILVFWMFLIILQNSFLSELVPLWLVPSFAICEAVILLREEKFWTAFLLAVFFGLLTDIFSSGPFGISILAYSLSVLGLEAAYRSVLPRGRGTWSFFMPVPVYMVYILAQYVLQYGFSTIVGMASHPGFWNIALVGSLVTSLAWMKARDALQSTVLKKLYEI